MKGFITKLIVVLVLFSAFGFYIYSNLGEINNTLHITTAALTGKMFLAFAIGISAYVLIVINFRRIYHMLGVEKSFSEMMKLELSSLATGVVLPSLGLSSSIVFIEDAAKHGYSRAKGLAAAILFIFTDYLSISILSLLGLLIFVTMGFFKWQVIIPVLLFLALTAGVAFLIFLASARKSKARSLIIKLAKKFSGIFKKILKSSYDPEQVAEKILNEFSLTTQTVKKDSKHYRQTVIMAIVTHLIRIISLYFVFISLGFAIQPHVLLAGYVVGMVLVVISPTPNGIGFVEGGMLLIFTSLGVPASIAGTATIIYRGFQFWLPFFIGLFLVQRGQLRELKKEVKSLDEELK